MGSSSLKAEVNAFDRLQIVRDRNSSYFGSKYKSWTVRARCFGASSLPSTNASWMATFAVTSVSSPFCQASTCFRIGSKLRCIRSTPTEMQSMSENDFECFASTGGDARGTNASELGNPRALNHQSPESHQGKLVGMRKRLITPTPEMVRSRGEGWLDVERAAIVEFTSEDKD